MCLTEKDCADETDDDQEDHHGPEKVHGARKLMRIVICFHAFPTAPPGQMQFRHGYTILPVAFGGTVPRRVGAYCIIPQIGIDLRRKLCGRFDALQDR
ncbi:hypothetical protein D3C87_1758770 [compost metagenome]